MKRRDFIAVAVASAAGTAALTSRAVAGTSSNPLHNLVFTAADPGHWKGVESLHVPIVTHDNGQLKVTTPHPMTEPHYIVSHTVTLQDGSFLSRKTFNWKDHPTSEHKLPAGYKGRLYVTSTCNLHDFWMTETKV